MGGFSKQAGVGKTLGGYALRFLRRRTLADAMDRREITTIGDAKAISDLFALLVAVETGFPVVEPGR
jgi:hypothetical protein